jgi:hypothetical protein
MLDAGAMAAWHKRAAACASTGPFRPRAIRALVGAEKMQTSLCPKQGDHEAGSSRCAVSPQIIRRAVTAVELLS